MTNAWVTPFPIPAPNTPLIDTKTGLMNKDWYRYFSQIDALMRQVKAMTLTDLADVIYTGTPANGEQLTYYLAGDYWTNYTP